MVLWARHAGRASRAMPVATRQRPRPVAGDCGESYFQSNRRPRCYDVMVEVSVEPASHAAFAHPGVAAHSACPTSTGDVARPHRRPAQFNHKTLQSFSRLGCPLEPWKVELFKNRIGGDALDAVMTDLASDIPEGSGPRVLWFCGPRDTQSFDEGLCQHFRYFVSFHTGLDSHLVVTGHAGLGCCNRSRKMRTVATYLRPV